MTPNLVWYAGWFVLGTMLGSILVCVLPIIAGPMLDRDKRTDLGRKFGHASMFAYGRAVLVRRKHGGHALLGSKFDSEKEAEEVTIGGEKKHFEDPNTVMQLLQNKKFACAYERSEILTSPKLADIGRAAREFRDGGHNTLNAPVTDEDGSVTGYQQLFSTHLPLDLSERMVDLADSFNIAPGSLAPGDAETAEEYTKISQEGFQSADIMTTVQFLTAYGVGALGAYLVVESGTAGGGGFGGVGLPTGGMTILPTDLLLQALSLGVVF